MFLQFINLKRKMKKRIVWKKIIDKHGLSKVLNNPVKYLPLHRNCYSDNFLSMLQYRILINHTPFKYINNGSE